MRLPLYRGIWRMPRSSLVAAYVDDLLVGTNSTSTFKWFSDNFIRNNSNPQGFRAKHLGKVNYFLGMAIDQFDDFSMVCKPDEIRRENAEEVCSIF